MPAACTDHRKPSRRLHKAGGRNAAPPRDASKMRMAAGITTPAKVISRVSSGVIMAMAALENISGGKHQK